MKTCTLILPEFLTVPSVLSRELSLPALEQLLRYSHQSAADEQCYEESIYRSIAGENRKALDIPIASYRWSQHHQDAMPEQTLCADPIHLRADKDQARLLDCSALSLSDEHAKALIASLNDLYKEDGWLFTLGTAGQWYFSGLDASALQTQPVKSLVGRNIANFLPEGEHVKQWRRLITEVQMFLFSHPVNQERASQGLLPVNSLWFWGSGSTPQQIPSQGVQLSSKDDFSLGFAKAASCEFIGLEYLFSEDNLLKADDAVLLDLQIMDAILYEDWHSWQSQIEQLEVTVFLPILNALKSSKLQSVELNFANGYKRTTSKLSLKKFWKRNTQLEQFFKGGSSC